MRTILLSLLACLPLIQAFATPTPYHHYRLNQSLTDSGLQNSPLISVGVAPIYGAGHFTHLSNDYAASFNGGDNHLTVATAFLAQTVKRSYTVSAWFKPDRAPVKTASSDERFFVFETSPDYSASLGLRDGDDSNNTKIQFYAQTEGSNAETISIEIPDSEITARWYHAALTFDGTTLTAYLDGESIGSLNLSGKGAIKPATRLNIGTYRDANGRFFDGLIDEVAVWYEALPPSEIMALSDEAATTRYVNFLNIGLEVAPYTSWNTAAIDLQDALAIARPGDQIWIAKGNYYPDQGGGQTNNDQNATFSLKNRIAIYGGFAGAESSTTQADPAANPTILSGDIDQNNGSEEPRDFDNHLSNSYHVLTAENVDATALLNGLTIKYGFAAGTPVSDQHGAGLSCKNASPTLDNLTFEANVAVAGAAISFDGASPSIANSTFRNNAAGDGGAFYALNASNPTISNSIFHGNIALDNGGVVFSAESTPAFTNCAFYGNQAGKKAGVFFNYDSNPILTNCTLYGNSSEREGGALYNAENSFPKLRNSIIWNNQADGVTNTADASIYNEDGNATVASNSLVENFFKTTLDASGTVTNLEPSDPLFLSNDPVATGNFQLRSSSPAIDAGNNSLNNSTFDLSGNTRIQNATIDLGAVEGGSTLRLYVKKDNAGASAPYGSWATAATTLQDALELSGAGDEIWVAQGTYYPDEGGAQINNERAATFQLKENVGLYGGFTGTETERTDAAPRINETILSGDIDQNDGSNFSNTDGNSHNVLIAISLDATTILQGFTIQAGNFKEGNGRGNGAGLHCNSASIIIADCIFQNNQGDIEGGAIYFENGSPVIKNTIFRGNYAEFYGGAIYNFNAQAKFINCVFLGNVANFDGGAIYNDLNTHVELTNCSLSGNQANDDGGAIYNFSATVTLNNTIIWNNQASDASNSQSASIDGGGNAKTYRNCLIANYTAADLDDSDDSSANNLESTDPRFVSTVDPADAPTTAGDLRLGQGSPAINAGDNNANVIPTDIAENARIQNDTIDLGAYEIPGADSGLWSISTPAPIDTTSLDVTFTLNSGNLPNNWESSIEIVTFGQLSHSNPTFSNSGSEYTITLNNLSGEGRFTIEFEADDQTFYDLGFIPIGTTGGTFQRYISSTPVHYVNAANTTPEAPYDTWGKAAANLQDALAYAAFNDDVWVAQGTYYPDEGSLQTEDDKTSIFTIKPGRHLYGGFEGGETERSSANPQEHETILSGDIDQDNTLDNNCHSVLGASHIAAIDGTTIQGFTIEGGNATNSGGGINLYAASLAIRNCTFRNNQASYGGAISNEAASSPSITHCLFIGNEAHLDGGAIRNLSNSSPRMENCLFSGNYAGELGGAISNSIQSAPSITNSTFQGNRAYSLGGALSNDADSFPTFTNCIIWNNQAGDVTNTASASVYHPNETGPGPAYYNCLVENYTKTQLDNSSLTQETNYEPTDPKFILETDPANAPTIAGNLRLKSISPAIDTGLNNPNTSDTDLDGNVRIQNETIDLGAYEVDPDTLPPIIVFDPDSNDQSVTLRWRNGGVLQTSTNLKQWFDVTDAQSPLIINLEPDSHRFWRLQMPE